MKKQKTAKKDEMSKCRQAAKTAKTGGTDLVSARPVSSASTYGVEIIAGKILLIRGQKVMLDRDLAELYGVTTGNLNKAVNRNIERFPEDFMFQLSKEEFKNLIFQFGTSRWGGTRKHPSVFTEHGILMLSSVLNSARAIRVNIQIMWAFVRVREYLATHKDVLRKLDEHDRQIRTLFGAVNKLLEPPPEKPKQNVRRGGNKMLKVRLRRGVLNMKKNHYPVKYEDVAGKVIEIRGEKVILDSEVAELYGVKTKWINQAVANNPEKFPDNYVFEVRKEEKTEVVKNFDHLRNLKFSPYLPKAFSEKGLYMLATILKSPKAVQTTLAIIEAFVKLRQLTRNIKELSVTKDKDAQKSLMRESGVLAAEILDEGLETIGSETPHFFAVNIFKSVGSILPC